MSHSVRRTKRRFLPNLQWKKVWNPVTQVFQRIRVATSALRTLQKPLSKRDEARMLKKVTQKTA